MKINSSRNEPSPGLVIASLVWGQPHNLPLNSRPPLAPMQRPRKRIEAESFVRDLFILLRLSFLFTGISATIQHFSNSSPHHPITVPSSPPCAVITPPNPNPLSRRSALISTTESTPVIPIKHKKINYWQTRVPQWVVHVPPFNREVEV
jgi:hypothetical protein